MIGNELGAMGGERGNNMDRHLMSPRSTAGRRW